MIQIQGDLGIYEFFLVSQTETKSLMKFVLEHSKLWLLEDKGDKWETAVSSDPYNGVENAWGTDFCLWMGVHQQIERLGSIVKFQCLGHAVSCVRVGQSYFE